MIERSHFRAACLVACAVVALGAGRAEARKGLLVVTSTPEGVPFAVNGRSSGTAPAELKLNPGTYKISVSDKCWQAKSERVKVRSGGKHKVKLAPVPVLVTLEIEVKDEAGNPVEVTLAVDGKPLSGSPAQVPLCSQKLVATDVHGDQQEVALELTKEGGKATVTMAGGAAGAAEPAASSPVDSDEPSAADQARARGVSYVVGGTVFAVGGLAIAGGGAVLGYLLAVDPVNAGNLAYPIAAGGTVTALGLTVVGFGIAGTAIGVGMLASPPSE